MPTAAGWACVVGAAAAYVLGRAFGIGELFVVCAALVVLVAVGVAYVRASCPRLDALRSRLDALRQAHRQAQEDLTALQANKGAKSVGTFSAIKQVFELQRQIDELLKSYPQLK